MSSKRKRYEVASLSDDEEDMDMDGYNEEGDDAWGEAVKKEDDVQGRICDLTMQKTENKCWRCPNCNMWLNMQQCIEKGDGIKCFRCGEEWTEGIDKPKHLHSSEWKTEKKLKWRCIKCCIDNNDDSELYDNKKILLYPKPYKHPKTDKETIRRSRFYIFSNQCQWGNCDGTRNDGIKPIYGKWRPTLQDIDRDKGRTIINGNLWHTLCWNCGYREFKSVICGGCGSEKKISAKITQKQSIDVVTGVTKQTQLSVKHCPIALIMLILSFWVEWENNKPEAIEAALKNGTKKEEKPEKKKDKTMTKVLSEEKVKGTTNEHVWPIKVTMKYRDDEDIIGKEGCFRIGVVSGERHYYLTGDGKFVDPSGKIIDAFYDGKIKNGDIIRVKLNMTFGRLEYEINGEDLGVAFKFGCHKKCRKNYKFYAYFKKKEIKCEKLGYELNKHSTWNCEKCTTLGKIKQDVCRYCNWSRIKGKARGYDNIIAVHQKYEDKLNGTGKS